MSDLEVYVATHRADDLPTMPSYKIMQVGRSLSGERFGDIGDDEGAHISNMNASFCELTALYWIWKNATARNVGLVHHRRHFAHKAEAIELRGKEIASRDDLLSDLDRFNIILPHPMVFLHENTNLPMSVEQQYVSTAYGHDLVLARRAVCVKHSTYIPAFDFVMRNNQSFAFNIFVGHKVLVDRYCEWLFSILFLLEDWVPYKTYDSYQGRVFGFLAERLFNVWLAHNRRLLRPSHRNVVSL